ADILTVTARLLEDQRYGPLHQAAEALDRAAREPYRRPLPDTGRREHLRAMSRLLHLMGQLGDDEWTFGILRTITDLAMLANALADLRDAQDRLHQAKSAREAARLLHTVSGRPPSKNAPAARPSTLPPTPGRDRRPGARPPGDGRTR
ncbi:MAG: relaxase, partial [Dactylosporangium sp.]|nr:relaxase [Dactylosporangium sp.]NNJ62239.1 relaxase [Dactylosporangium sp.]